MLYDAVKTTKGNIITMNGVTVSNYNTLPDSFVYYQLCSIYTFCGEYVPIVLALGYLHILQASLRVHVLSYIGEVLQTFQTTFFLNVSLKSDYYFQL